MPFEEGPNRLELVRRLPPGTPEREEHQYQRAAAPFEQCGAQRELRMLKRLGRLS